MREENLFAKKSNSSSTIARCQIIAFKTLPLRYDTERSIVTVVFSGLVNSATKLVLLKVPE